MRRSGAIRLEGLPKRKAEFIEPMDCAPITKLSDGPVNLFSSRRKSFDHHCPLIVEALGELPEGTVVDGEVVALGEAGRPNFNLLQNFRSEASRIHYFILDPLICQDRYLTRVALSERRKLMKSVLKLRSPHLRISEQVRGHSERHACRHSPATIRRR